MKPLKSLSYAVLTVALIFNSSYAFAHSGNTNSAGCHTETRTGTLHCHNAKGDSNSNKSAGLILGGAVLAIAVIAIVAEKNKDKEVNFSAETHPEFGFGLSSSFEINDSLDYKTFVSSFDNLSYTSSGQRQKVVETGFLLSW